MQGNILEGLFDCEEDMNFLNLRDHNKFTQYPSNSESEMDDESKRY